MCGVIQCCWDSINYSYFDQKPIINRVLLQYISQTFSKKSHHGDFCCSDTEWVNEGGGTAAGGRVPVAWNVSAGLYGSAGQGVADNPVKPVSHMLSWTIGLCRISKDWESNLNY